ncbi:MAG: hypothetical protein RLZZ97_1306 [Gemmatimonadota bacterium]
MTSPMHTAEQLSAALAGRYVVEHQIGEGGETVRTVLPRWLQFPPGADYGLTRLTSAFSSSTKLNTTTGSGRDRPTMRIIRKRVPSADTSYCGV